MNDVTKLITEAADGSVITLPPGSHRANLTVSKSLTIKGSRPGTTLIGGSPDDAVMTIAAKRVIVADIAVHQPNGAVAVRVEADAYPQFRAVQITGGTVVGACSMVECKAPQPIIASEPSRPIRLRIVAGATAFVAAVVLLATLWQVRATEPATVPQPPSGRPTTTVATSTTRRPTDPGAANHPAATALAGEYIGTIQRSGASEVLVLFILAVDAGKSPSKLRFRAVNDFTLGQQESAKISDGTYDPRTGRVFLGPLGSGEISVEQGHVVLTSVARGVGSWRAVANQGIRS